MSDRIEEVIAAVARGEIVVLIDDEQRENEADLIMAADLATPESINFMARHGRGLICAPLTASRAAELCLPEMAPAQDRFGTAFTVSVDARKQISTGISAADRARTIKLLADPAAGRADFQVPGHVFPLIARAGGVLARAGHTEAAVDLALLAGRQPAGVICEIMNDDGSMARRADTERFAAEHRLKWCTIAELVQYRQRHERLVEKAGEVRMPSRWSDEDFTLHCYVAPSDGREHIALCLGDLTADDDLLVRVHSECLTGDVFHSARCDCGEQLEKAIAMIAKAGRGIVIYLRQEGRGIGLINKIRAYDLQDHGLDTVEANEQLGFPPDSREYGVAAQILQDLGVGSIRLLTNNPDKVSGLVDCGIKIRERLPLIIPARERNRFYLETKRDRMGHLL